MEPMVQTGKDAIVKELERKLVPSSDILKYMLAGKATFTIRSVETQKRFTYKVAKVKTHNPRDPRDGQYYVFLLTGPDNENSFHYMGMLHTEKSTWTGKKGFSATPRSFAHLTPSDRMKNAPAMTAFDFLWRWLNLKPELTEKIEFWHSGRCGRCGKKLTVPESIAMGLGPDCAEKGF